jgi:hypothetical protein
MKGLGSWRKMQVGIGAIWWVICKRFEENIPRITMGHFRDQSDDCNVEKFFGFWIRNFGQKGELKQKFSEWKKWVEENDC